MRRKLPGARLLLVANLLVALLAAASPPRARDAAASHAQGTTARPPYFSVHFVDDVPGQNAIIDIGEHEIVIASGGSKDALSKYVEETGIVDGPVELFVLTHYFWGPKPLNDLLAASAARQHPVLELWGPGFEPDFKDGPFWSSRPESIPPDGFKSPLEQFHRPADKTGRLEPFTLPSIPEATLTVLSYGRLSGARDEPDRAGRAAVVMVEVAGVRMLFAAASSGKDESDPADAPPKYAEGRLVELGRRHPGALKAHILLAPAVGGEWASTQAFINAVSPRRVVFGTLPPAALPEPSVVRRYASSAHVYTVGAHPEPGKDHVVCTNRPANPDNLAVEDGDGLRCFYWGLFDKEAQEGDEPLVWQGSLKGEPFPEWDLQRDLHFLKHEGAGDGGSAGRDAQTDPKAETEGGLRGADLTGAPLAGADLSGADLRGANLSWADLSGANFTGANLQNAQLAFSYFDEKTAVGGANLSGTNLSTVRLPGELRGTVLSGADLGGLNLRGAKLVGGRLDKARLRGADLAGAVVETQPGYGPDFNEMTTARYLDTLTFENSPHTLVELREAFKKAGLREQERRLTYAIEHEKNEKNRRDGKWVEYLFNYLLFDLTTRYAMSPARPLILLGFSILLFSVPYMLALRARGRGGVWKVWLPDRVEKDRGKAEPERVTAVYTRVSARGLGASARVARVVFLGLYFSLISAFQVGYRDFNVGSWISRIQASEYTLRPTGWVRVVSGIQSLLSLFLLALWVLTYFGRPFD